jgi:MoxR-like ATPase
MARAARRAATPKGRRQGSTTRLGRKAFQDRFDLMVDNMSKVIKGKEEIVRLALTCLLANGHVLFEDLPGTGKTMLCRALSQTMDADFSRVQCTPDLLPADVTGAPVLDRKTGNFVFRPGPVFANIFLADEINRATPKTQAALLEAMAEGNVTIDGVSHPLPDPFFVLGTQNPIELAGTFPLPEAQLDRFLFKLSLGYLDRMAELDVLDANRVREAIESLSPVVSTNEVVAMIDWAKEVTISEAVLLYIVDLVHATRTDPALEVGASTRAALALQKASRVLAASQGREDVLPDDVKSLATPVLAHRVILTPDATLRDETVEGVIDRVVTRIKVPMAGKGGGRASGKERAAASA